MRHLSTPRIGKAATLKLVSLTMALLLQACGGGGGGGSTPGSKAPGEAVPDSQPQLPVGHFLVTETRTLGDVAGAEPSVATLLVVDRRNNSIALKVLLENTSLRDDFPEAITQQWLHSERGQYDAATGRVTLQGASQLFYISKGKLMQLDLSGDALGTPREITVTAPTTTTPLTVCGMGQEMLQLNQAGTDGWLPVSTAGLGSVGCADLNLRDNRLVPLGTLAAGSSAVGLDASNQHWLITPFNDQGQALGQLVADRSSLSVKLVLLNTQDMKTGQTIPLSGGAPLDFFSPVKVLGPVPGSTQQYLVHIGKTIRIIDWRSGTIAVGAPLLTLQSTRVSAFIGDKRHAYIADGCSLHRIDPAGIATLWATLPAADGAIGELTLANDHIMASQQQPSYDDAGVIIAAPGCTAGAAGIATTTLHALNRSSGQRQALLPTHAQRWHHVLGAAGNEAYVLQRSTTGADLLRINMNSAATDTVAAHIQLIDAHSDHKRSIGPRSFPLGEADITNHQLMWCKISRADSTQCEAGDDFVSHIIATKQDVVVGKMPSLAGKMPTLPGGGAYSGIHLTAAVGELWANESGLLEIGIAYPGTNGLRLPWLVTPGLAGSLRDLPGALPDAH